MALGQAHEAWAGIGRQVTLGTLAARTKFFDIVSESMRIDSQRDVAPILGSVSKRVFRETGRRSSGVIELVGNLEGHEALYKDAFGTVVTTGVGPFTHTITLAKVLPSPGLSLEINRDVKSFLYESCKVNQVEWSQDPNGYMRVRFSLLARNETRATASSPTFPAAKPMTADLAVFNIGGAPVVLHNFRCTLDNALSHRGQLGSKDSREIVRTGQRSVMGSFEIDFEDEVEYGNFIAATSRAIDITWTSGADSCKLESPAIQFLGDTPTAGGFCALRIPFRFIALEQTRAAMDELKLTFINTTTSVI